MTTAGEEDDAYPEDRYRAPQPNKRDAFDWITLNTAIVGVIVLCIYTGLTGYQAYLAKDTAERQLRAYLSASFEWPDVLGGSDLTMTIKNHGQTPAFKVSNWAYAILATNPLPVDAVEKARQRVGDWQTNAVLFPGAEFKSGTVKRIDQFGIKIEPISDEDKTLIRAGWRAVWLVGEINYLDAFGFNRFTHFRLYMTGEFMVSANKLAWATEGNEAN